MPITLTQWWSQLDNEARGVATLCGIDYPKSSRPDQVVEAKNPWLVVHQMASLGMTLEENVAYGGSIAGQIKSVEQGLGGQVPNSEHCYPIISDEFSLLLAIVHYRSQCRFQDIESTNRLIQNGFLAIKGIKQNKPMIAQDVDFLKKEITTYCSVHQEIAKGAKEKFHQFFSDNNAVGYDLFEPITLETQYINFAQGLIDDFVTAIDNNANGVFGKVHEQIINKTDEIQKKLERTKLQLEELYLYQKIRDFVAIETDFSHLNLTQFKKWLNSDGLEKNQRTNRAEQIWMFAEHSAKQKESVLSKAAGVVRSYTPRVIGNFAAPVARLLSFDEQSALAKFKGHFCLHLELGEKTASSALNETTKLTLDSIKGAKSTDIQRLLKTNHELYLEVQSLRSSITSYIAEVKKDSPTARFLAWLTHKVPEWEFLNRMLHKNVHYLRIAEKFKHELDVLDESNFANRLETIKVQIATEMDDVDSKYTVGFFSKDSVVEKAAFELNSVINPKKN